MKRKVAAVENFKQNILPPRKRKNDSKVFSLIFNIFQVIYFQFFRMAEFQENDDYGLVDVPVPEQPPTVKSNNEFRPFGKTF